MTNASPLYYPGHLRTAVSFVGTREGAGAKDNPVVLKFYRDCGFNVAHDSTAWCAAFVGSCLHVNNLPHTHSLAARSYEAFPKLAKPLFGCIGVKKRPGSGWFGHVGFVVAADATHIWLLGGNQGDAVSVARFDRGMFTAFVVPPGFNSALLSPCPSVPPSNLKTAAGVVSEA